MKFRRLLKIGAASLLAGLAVIALLAFAFAKDISGYFCKLGDNLDVANRGQAIVDYSWAIFFYHKNSLAYFSRGLAKFSEAPRDIDGAIADYNRSLAILADDTVLRERARAEIAKHDNEGAMRDLNEVLTKANWDFESYQQRGNLRLQMDDMDGAIADFTAAIKGYPDSTKTSPQYYALYNSRAIAEYLSGQEPEALADMRRMLELSSDGQDLPRLLIWTIESEDPNQRDAANKQLNDYLNNPTGESYPWMVPVAHYLIGATTQEDFLKAIDDDHDLKGVAGLCYLFVGVKSELNGDSATALTYLQKSKTSMQSSGIPTPVPDFWLKRLARQN
jgi:tetratricopeptide (TPR) repeat protein